jgi:hypothetical protein
VHACVHADQSWHLDRRLGRSTAFHAAGDQHLIARAAAFDVKQMTCTCTCCTCPVNACWPNIHMREACNDLKLQVKLLARPGCEFCPRSSPRYKVHWQLGVRCCSSCFKDHTCTTKWYACSLHLGSTCAADQTLLRPDVLHHAALHVTSGSGRDTHVICRAHQRYRLPIDMLAALPTEKSERNPYWPKPRVLNRDLGPLLQQVRLVRWRC